MGKADVNYQLTYNAWRYAKDELYNMVLFGLFV